MKYVEMFAGGVGGLLFLVSLAGYIYVKIKLRPQDSADDDYYYEFEDQQPGYARYAKWSRITFSGVVISMLLLFVAVVI